MRPSYLFNWDLYSGKMASLYSDGPLGDGMKIHLRSSYKHESIFEH